MRLVCLELDSKYVAILTRAHECIVWKEKEGKIEPNAMITTYMEETCLSVEKKKVIVNVSVSVHNTGREGKRTEQKSKRGVPGS